MDLYFCLVFIESLLSSVTYLGTNKQTHTKLFRVPGFVITSSETFEQFHEDKMTPTPPANVRASTT